jgi:hypothetical protein
MASLGKHTYESVNGPIPEGNPIDANGLAQQVRGGFTTIMPEVQQMIVEPSLQPPDMQSMIDLDSLMMTSNIAPNEHNLNFLQEAHAAAAERHAQGYKADGTLNGEYDETNPPPGKANTKYIVGIVFSFIVFLKKKTIPFKQTQTSTSLTSFKLYLFLPNTNANPLVYQRPGKTFGGFLKGNMGIVWKDKDSSHPSTRLLNRVFSDVLPNGDVEELSKLLTERSIDVNLVIGKGPTSKHTLLHWCASRGQVAMIQVLLENGVDLTLEDLRGRTAATLAKENEHDDVVALLSTK